MIPDGIPFRCQEVPERLVVRLAGQYIRVGLDTHVVERCRATLHTQVQRHRVKTAILGGCIPDEALAALFSLPAGDIQQGA